MSNYDLLMAQYESMQKKETPKKERVSNDDRLKKYFTSFIPESEQSAQKIIRLLPGTDGKSPFEVVKGHSIMVNGKSQKFICPEFANNEPCPFCEAKGEILKNYDSKNENSKKLLKQYNQRDFFVIKLIERGKEDEGVKFWRFNRDYRNAGIYDKIMDIIKTLGSYEDIFSVTNGIDLIININRDQNGNATVTSIIASRNNTPLTNDENLTNELLSNTETWRDVYKVYPYEYLSLLVRGETPVWDKETSTYISKTEYEEKNLNKENAGDSAINDLMESTKPVDHSDSVIINANSFQSSLNTEVGDTQGEDDDIPF